MATLEDIADRAGVSIGTVDRILHKRGRYSPETAAKVREIIEEVDYRPNLMARRLSKSKTCRIAAFLPRPEQDSGYWGLTLEGIRRAGGELTPFGLNLDILHFNRYDAEQFLQTGRRLIGGEYDGILMAPLREDESRSLLRHLDKEVPVAFFDTDLPGFPRMSYIGQDSYVSGQLAGRLMNLLVGSYTGVHTGADTLVLTPDAENEHLKRRFEGFRDVFTGSIRSIRISIESDHDKDALHRVLEREINSPSNSRHGTHGLFVTDASAHYAAEYLSAGPTRTAKNGKRGKRGKTPGSRRPHCFMVGYDLVEENRRWLEEGTIDFLLTQRPEEQGYDGINRLFRKIVLDEDPPEHIYTPIDIVTKENLGYHNIANREEKLS